MALKQSYLKSLEHIQRRAMTVLKGLSENYFQPFPGTAETIEGTTERVRIF
jgi:hypothetical protein